jgi:hypothetical protein
MKRSLSPSALLNNSRTETQQGLDNQPSSLCIRLRSMDIWRTYVCPSLPEAAGKNSAPSFFYCTLFPRKNQVAIPTRSLRFPSCASQHLEQDRRFRSRFMPAHLTVQLEHRREWLSKSAIPCQPHGLLPHAVCLGTAATLAAANCLLSRRLTPFASHSIIPLTELGRKGAPCHHWCWSR